MQDNKKDNHSMKIGNLVRFIEPDALRGTYNVREDTSGIILGFHPKNGRVHVKWFQMGATPCPGNTGYWPWGTLKVYSAS